MVGERTQEVAQCCPLISLYVNLDRHAGHEIATEALDLPFTEAEVGCVKLIIGLFVPAEICRDVDDFALTWGVVRWLKPTRRIMTS